MPKRKGGYVLTTTTKRGFIALFRGRLQTFQITSLRASTWQVTSRGALFGNHRGGDPPGTCGEVGLGIGEPRSPPHQLRGGGSFPPSRSLRSLLAQWQAWNSVQSESIPTAGPDTQGAPDVLHTSGHLCPPARSSWTHRRLAVLTGH